MPTVEQILKTSPFSRFRDEDARVQANKATFENIDRQFDKVLYDIKQGTDYEGKEAPSRFEAYKLVNKFFWKVFGVNFIYSTKLNTEIEDYNQEQEVTRGEKISNKHWWTAEDGESITGQLVKSNQIINPDSDEQRTIYYFVKNIDKFIDEIFDKNREFMLQLLFQDKEQTKTGTSNNPDVEKYVKILKFIFNKIELSPPEIKDKTDFEKAKNAFKRQIVDNRDSLTIDEIVYLMRVYFLYYLPLSKEIKAAAEKPEEQPKPEVDAKATAVPDRKYNIREPKPSDFIGNYQSNLKKFYKNIPSLPGRDNLNKLNDSKYGSGTHYMGVIAVNEIIKQLNAHIRTSTKKESNEKRIANLSQLLESKLLGFNTELLVEQDQGKLDKLLARLVKIRNALIKQGGQSQNPPTENKFVQEKILKEYNGILSKLAFKDDKIDFDVTLKAMDPGSTATKGAATEKEKVAQVARTIRGTCWFNFDPNIGGIRSGTPIAVWAAAGANFEEWYRQIVELFNYEGASPQFNYKSGAAAQGRLKGAPDKLNDNKNQSISLGCLSIHMTKLAENFYRNGDIATRLLSQAKGTNDEAKINKVRDGAKYFLKGDTYEGSVAHGLEQVLNRVIDILRSFRRGQIQQAIKTLAPSSKAPEEAKQAARKVVAYAKRDEKAIEKLAVKAKTRAAATPAAAGAAPPKAAGAAGAPPAKPAAALKAPAASAPAAKPAPATQQESLKQRREKLLNEAIFKKLVR